MACIVQIRVISRGDVVILVHEFEPVNELGSKNMTIGDRLKKERSRLGLSQTDLGAAGGVGKTTQINYEKGTGSPDARYLFAISELGVDVLYVVTGVETPRPVEGLTVGEERLVKRYRTLPEGDQQAVDRIVGAMWEIAVRESA